MLGKVKRKMIVLCTVISLMMIMVSGCGDVAEKAVEDAAEKAVEDAAKDVAEKAVEGAAEKTAEDASKDATEKVVEDASKDAAEEAVEDATEKAAEKALEGAAKETAEKAPVEPGREGGFWEGLNTAENTWSMETELVTKDYTAEDGTVVFHYETDRFWVTNSVNPEAAQRVMDFLEKRTTDVAVMAKDAETFYEDSRNNENINFYEQDYEQSYSADQVNGYLSVIVGEGGYLGGAHGFYNETAWVFDPDGNRVSLEDLFGDVNVVREAVVEELKAQIEKIDQTLFYDKETYEPNLGDLFCVGNDTWYLSENGIELISNPYIIAPFASGIIYFTIPYDTVV